MLASGAVAQFAAKLPAQPGHAAAQSVVDATKAESMWAPSIAADAAIRADALAAGAALAPHAGAVTKQNEQALSDTVETDEQNAKDLTGHPVVEV